MPCLPGPLHAPRVRQTAQLRLRRYLVPNYSLVLLGAYALYYVALDPLAGLSWSASMALPVWAAANAVRQQLAAAWAWAVGLHILSWVVQVHVGEEPTPHGMLGACCGVRASCGPSNVLWRPLYVCLGSLSVCKAWPLLSHQRH